MTNRIRIVSDGTVAGTFVTDSRGNTIDGIVKIEWVADGNKAAISCVLTAELVQVDLITDVDAIPRVEEYSHHGKRVL